MEKAHPLDIDAARRLETLARMLEGDVASILRGGDPAGKAMAADIRALLKAARPGCAPDRSGFRPPSDAQILAMARAHDEMEAAYRGEPSPWDDRTGRNSAVEAVWRSHRLTVMRCAAEVLARGDGADEAQDPADSPVDVARAPGKARP